MTLYPLEIVAVKRLRVIPYLTIAMFLCRAATAAPTLLTPWWTHAAIYEIYVRSFQDSNGDGVGDLQGVTQRLDYLHTLGVDAIWLTPFYPSPNADFGYDVADYTNVASEYGSLADWDRLVREAKRRGIRVLVDLVLNHSSNEHPWFKESRASRHNAKRNWYIWRDGKPDGQPPNNWEAIFGGPTWTWDSLTRQWYYHIFLPQQPDLNWANPELKKAMFDVVRFWLDRGASGFRLDATPYLFEDAAFPDDLNPRSGAPVWLKPYNSGRPENHAVLRDLRSLLNRYPGERVLLGESATANVHELASVYGSAHDEINLPMDFLFGNLTDLNGADFKRQIDDAELQLRGEPPVLFFSSHDHARQWSSFGDGVHNDAIAKLTAALALTPRGSALIYYGEEIGMGDLPIGELSAAPLTKTRQRADIRDKARTPMQWSAVSGAGFSSGTPWLPLSSDIRHHNVAMEQQDPMSILNWYRQLLELRHETTFRDGAYLPLHSSNSAVVAFGRKTRDGHAAAVILNCSGMSQHATLSGWPDRMPSVAKVLLATPDALLTNMAHIDLLPYAVIVASVH